MKNLERKKNLTATQHVHFIGIGGAGMSGIAQVLLDIGFEVSGSDLKESRNTERLKQYGARIEIGHRGESVDGADIVVISSAIPEKNPEVKHAKEKHIPILLRAQMLARLCEGKKSIAIAGTHGKTTTTSMVSRMMDVAGLDPTFLIGGELNDIGSNAKCGKGDYIVAEADESDGSFLYLRPQIIVLTNIEADHLEYYGNLKHIEEVFLEFVNQLQPDGFAIVAGDLENIKNLTNLSEKRFITYGLGENNDFSARNIVCESLASSFDVFQKDELLGRFHLCTPGVHNVLNALATIALGISLNVPFSKIAESLESFGGVQRRFQIKGNVSEVTIVDDYAHHPTELKATLEAAKKGHWNRIVCIFQPHRFSRTKFLGTDFKDAFDGADLAVLTEVYAAGEEPIPGVTGKLLVDAVLRHNPRKPVVYLPKKSDILDFMVSEVREGDLVLTAGAGDIWTVGEGLLSLLETDLAKAGGNDFGQS